MLPEFGNPETGEVFHYYRSGNTSPIHSKLLALERSEEVLNKVVNDEAANSYVKETAISALSRLELVAKYKRVE